MVNILKEIKEIFEKENNKIEELIFYKKHLVILTLVKIKIKKNRYPKIFLI
jgi:hypothetical protein